MSLVGGLNLIYKRPGLHHTSRYTTLLFWYQHLLHLKPELKANVATIANFKEFSKFKRMSGITTEQVENDLLDEFYITEQSHLLKPYLDFNTPSFPKFGHIGTLDPFAMGSLAMPFGKLVFFSFLF